MLRIPRSVLLCLALFIGNTLSAQPLPPGKGQFTFANTRSNPDKPLTVWYYRPAQLTPQTKVVFVMHGMGRNAKGYRNTWATFAEQYGFLLLVPEFTEQAYPTATYQFGNVRDPDPQRWTFAVVEHLFDEIKAREPVAATRYYLYGHSAGAQFVHRYMLFMPQPRVALAISANAGSYTLPTYGPWHNARFPWVLEPNLVSEAQLKTVLGRNLLVLLGEDDNDPNHPQLTHAPEAEAQGPSRWERGHTFFNMGQQAAAVRNTPFGWRLATVPGVAHSDGGMSKAAARYIAKDGG